MAPSKFLFPIQQKGQTTSLITSTMTFFLAMGKKPGQRSFLAAKKNNRNLEAPLEKTWAQRWMLAGSRSLLREVSLLCQTSMVSSIPLANFINSATQSTSHQRFSNKKKHLQTCSFQPIQTIFPTFLPGTKRLIPRPLPYQRFSTSLFRCRIADFLRTEPTPKAVTNGCLDIVLQQIWWSFPRKATGSPTFHESAQTAGGVTCVSSRVQTVQGHCLISQLWNVVETVQHPKIVTTIAWINACQQPLMALLHIPKASSSKFGRLSGRFEALQALKPPLIQITRRKSPCGEFFWVSNSPFGPSFASFTSKKSAPLPTWKKRWR